MYFSVERYAPLQISTISAERYTSLQISTISAESVHLSVEMYTFLQFLQKVCTFLQKYKISAERGTLFCRNL